MVGSWLCNKSADIIACEMHVPKFSDQNIASMFAVLRTPNGGQ